MGLAASQCRFLMLTSRESDVEAKLMALSNQQMSLTNRATKLSMDYAKALSAQDVYKGENMVSYKSIMNPNMTADESGKISQYIFKTSKGAVVLSEGKAITCGLMDEIRAGKTVGTGYDFRKLYKTKDEFLAKVLSGYNSNLTDSTEASKALKQSGYKYEDKIMNNAIVSVSSDSVMYLSGYSFDSLEYAMGTQEDKLSSYACINTLDQFQYTDANVHAMVNEFVGNCVDAMANIFLSEDCLGSSTAVTYAVNYAKQKTLDYYGNQTIKESNKDVMQTLTSVDKLKNNATSPNILVSDVDYHTTEMTNIDQGSYNYKITDLTGKDIFVDTAQLTAVFLNYFDAGMLYSLVDASDDPKSTINLESDDVETLRTEAELIKALNDSNNPLKARIDSQTFSSIQSLNGYNKTNIGDAYGSATTGIFGDTLATASGTSTNNSTLSAQKLFYGHMYDSLAANGWSYNASITDNQFLSDQMQRQNIILYEYSSSTGTQGTALSIDDSNSGLSLVDSSSRLEQAQAAYQAESAKIDYKTSIIEAQMDTLNTELTSIQAEKESVQAIIDKKIEKFNLFG